MTPVAIVRLELLPLESDRLARPGDWLPARFVLATLDEPDELKWPAEAAAAPDTTAAAAAADE